MGANLSRRSGGIAIPSELTSYENTLQTDPELQSLYAPLHQRATRAISTIAAGFELRSLSFNSFREVTGILLDMNLDVVKVILECQDDIFGNDDLFALVKDYFNCSLLTLDFCNSLEKCLKRARDGQSIIQEALRRFSEEDGDINYEKTLEDLKLFKATGNPFDEEFFRLLDKVNSQQLLMLQELQLRKKKLDRRIRVIRGWRKVSNVIFAATFAAVLVCSVVAAAIAAPPVASVLAAAAAIPLGSVGKWVNSVLKKHEDALKEKGEMISSMGIGTWIAINDLESIRLQVEKFEIEIQLLLSKADFALRNDGAVKIVMEDIRGKMEVFMKSIDDLVEQSDRCSRNIRRARTVVLQRISRQSS